MTPLTHDAGAAGSVNPLDEIRDVGNGVNAIDQNLNQLRMLQDRALNETDSSSGTSRQLDQLTAETMANYRGLVQRLKELKGNKQAQSYRGQVDRLDRQLKERIQQYQQLEASHRQKMQGQMERQYRIVRPDADDGEVRAAVEDMSAGGQQVFQQAMMQSNRQGQARAVLNEVQNRHKELLKIEQQMTELTNMIIDLDTIIVQQEPMVQQIDEHVEKTQEDLKQANVELDTAVDTARSTRKKKWICCGICGKSRVTKPPIGAECLVGANILPQLLLSLLLSSSLSSILSSPTKTRAAPPRPSEAWSIWSASEPFPMYTHSLRLWRRALLAVSCYPVNSTRPTSAGPLRYPSPPISTHLINAELELGVTWHGECDGHLYYGLRSLCCWGIVPCFSRRLGVLRCFVLGCSPSTSITKKCR